jgi:hypothetical protein
MRKCHLALLFAVHGLVLLPLTVAAQAPKGVLGSFWGKVGEDDVGALCWAIAPPGATAATVAKFCYVRISGHWLRSDDKNYTVLYAAQKNGAIVTWARAAGVTIDEKLQDAIEFPIGRERVPPAEEMKQLLKAAAPLTDWVQNLRTFEHNISGVTSGEAFVAATRPFLEQWLLEESVAVPPAQDGLPLAMPEVSRPFELATRRVETEVLKRIVELQELLQEILNLLESFAWMALLGLVLVTAALVPRFVSLWPDAWPGPVRWLKTKLAKKSLSQSGTGEGAGASSEPDASEKLDEALKRVEELEEQAIEVRTKLAGLAGLDLKSGSECSLEKIGQYLASMKSNGGEAPVTLKEASKHFMTMASLLGSCKERLDKILVPEVQPAATWAEPGFTTHLKSKCDAISDKLNRLNAVVAHFKPLGYSEGLVPRAAEQAVSLLHLLQGEITNAKGDLGIAKGALGAHFRNCRQLAATDHGALSNASESVSFARGVLLDQGEKIRLLEQEKSRLEVTLRELEAVFQGFSRNNEPTLDTAKRVVLEPERALGLLRGIRGLASETLLNGVRTLAQQLDSADNLIRSILPETPDPIDVAVSVLVERYQKATEELKVRITLEQGFRSYLNFGQDGQEGMEPVQRGMDLLQGESEGAHRALRLGLGGALATWEQGIFRLRSTSRGDILDELRLDVVERGLRDLLAGLEKMTDGSLGGELEGRFLQDWLHLLFRAEILLDTYFADLDPCSVLREAVKLAAGAIRVTLNHFDCRVLRVDLLTVAPLLRVTDDRVHREKDASFEFRQIKEVRERVLPYLESNGKDVFVDIRSFVYLKGTEENWHLEVVGITPADWRE